MASNGRRSRSNNNYNSNNDRKSNRANEFYSSKLFLIGAAVACAAAAVVAYCGLMIVPLSASHHHYRIIIDSNYNTTVNSIRQHLQFKGTDESLIVGDGESSADINLMTKIQQFVVVQRGSQKRLHVNKRVKRNAQKAAVNRSRPITIITLANKLASFLKSGKFKKMTERLKKRSVTKLVRKRRSLNKCGSKYNVLYEPDDYETFKPSWWEIILFVGILLLGMFPVAWVVAGAVVYKTIRVFFIEFLCVSGITNFCLNNNRYFIQCMPSQKIVERCKFSRQMDYAIPKLLESNEFGSNGKFSCLKWTIVPKLQCLAGNFANCWYNRCEHSDGSGWGCMRNHWMYSLRRAMFECDYKLKRFQGGKFLSIIAETHKQCRIGPFKFQKFTYPYRKNEPADAFMYVFARIARCISDKYACPNFCLVPSACMGEHMLAKCFILEQKDNEAVQKIKPIFEWTKKIYEKVRYCLCQEYFEYSIPSEECMLDVAVCVSDNECINGGTCSEIKDSKLSSVLGRRYNCECTPAWTGINCEEARNPCLDPDVSSFCLMTPGAKCVRSADDMVIGFTCECPNGFLAIHDYGKPGCIDINECAISVPCLAGGICHNTIGSFTCTCINSHSGDRCEIQPPSSQWDNWGEWSKCSVTCGHGYKQRIRECLLSETCIGSPKQIKECVGLAYDCSAEALANRQDVSPMAQINRDSLANILIDSSYILQAELLQYWKLGKLDNFFSFKILIGVDKILFDNWMIILATGAVLVAFLLFFIKKQKKFREHSKKMPKNYIEESNSKIAVEVRTKARAIRKQILLDVLNQTNKAASMLFPLDIESPVKEDEKGNRSESGTNLRKLERIKLTRQRSRKQKFEADSYKAEPSVRRVSSKTKRGMRQPSASMKESKSNRDYLGKARESKEISQPNKRCRIIEQSKDSENMQTSSLGAGSDKVEEESQGKKFSWSSKASKFLRKHARAKSQGSTIDNDESKSMKKKDHGIDARRPSSANQLQKQHTAGKSERPSTDSERLTPTTKKEKQNKMHKKAKQLLNTKFKNKQEKNTTKHKAKKIIKTKKGK